MEISERGGIYEYLKISNGKIYESATKQDKYFTIRGIYKENYFLFNTPNENQIKEEIKINKFIPYTRLTFPFLSSSNYDIKQITKQTKTNNLLTLESVFDIITFLMKTNLKFSAFIYCYKGRISPFASEYPVKSIINTKGLKLNHDSSKIVLNIQSENLKINKIFNDLESIKNFSEKLLNTLNETKKLKSLKTYTPDNEKIILSPKATARILYEIKNNFSITDYFENPKNPFKNQKNKKIFSHKVTIKLNPLKNKFFPLINFDETGQIKKNISLIDKGYLRNFAVSWHESLNYKSKPTGNTVLNSSKSVIETLEMKGNDKIKIKDIVNNEKNILYIDDIILKSNIYNPNKQLELTAFNSSFLYKNGLLHKKIENLYLKLSLKDIFMNIAEISQQEENLGIISPYLLLDIRH